MKVWKWRNVSSVQITRLQLQWGHTGEGVEMAWIAARWSCAMELQWGHTGEGVEMLAKHGHVDPAHLLQWGHTGEGVEIRLRRGGTGRGAGCFNGATPVKVWKSRRAVRVAHVHDLASMGPHR